MEQGDKKGMHRIMFIVSIHVAKSGQNPIIGTWFIISFDKYFWLLKSIIFSNISKCFKHGIFPFPFHLFKELVVITYSSFIRLSGKWMLCSWILTYWNNKTLNLPKYLSHIQFKWECLHFNSNVKRKFPSKTKIPLLMLISTGQAVRGERRHPRNTNGMSRSAAECFRIWSY